MYPLNVNSIIREWKDKQLRVLLFKKLFTQVTCFILKQYSTADVKTLKLLPSAGHKKWLLVTQRATTLNVTEDLLFRVLNGEPPLVGTNLEFLQTSALLLETKKNFKKPSSASSVKINNNTDNYNS